MIYLGFGLKARWISERGERLMETWEFVKKVEKLGFKVQKETPYIFIQYKLNNGYNINL